ncbi:uncharacterized protein VTP21DRAFT_10643 [Calcarisporiella thermophila]|uniref:uncharacterized protein n=1 Tax=Calcarisporiella thermophila TaxID=911321 RepID=UPI0037430768
MDYVGKVGRALSSVSQFYKEINPATLSGAIDIIVVEQPNGELACSPFHVRFGKLTVLRPQEKLVEFRINGELIDLPMKISETGETFFVFETEDEVPEELQTSPPMYASSGTIGSDQEEPPFLDLSSSNATNQAQKEIDDDPGYVSAHSAHDLDDDEFLSSNTTETSNPYTLPASTLPLSNTAKDRSETAITLSNVESENSETSDVFDATGYKTDKKALLEEAEANRPTVKTERMIDLVHLAEMGEAKAIYRVQEEPLPQTTSASISSGVQRLRERSKSLPVDYAGLDILESKPEQKEQPLAAKSKKNYMKTLRLTSDQLKKLNLKKGVSTLSFTVSSSYYGKSTCVSKLFFWSSDTQIVISDIDGTITKSDALGHLFTMVGKDWTHVGVAKLFSQISNNGYSMLYLTSRSLGQADYTRDYLVKVNQNKYSLPDGPVIMSPDRLLSALHREVVMRKPEVFKMACLKDIKRLFGNKNPFYAGFGNRITDALSYRSVGIPASRIFTINPYGVVELDLLAKAGYNTTYTSINELVDMIFPPIKPDLSPAAAEFNDYNWWKPALPDIELPELEPHDNSASSPKTLTAGEGTPTSSRKRKVLRTITEYAGASTASPSQSGITASHSEPILTRLASPELSTPPLSPSSSSSYKKSPPLSPSLLAGLVSFTRKKSPPSTPSKHDQRPGREIDEEYEGDREEDAFDEDDFDNIDGMKTPFDLDKIPFL